MRNPPLSYSLFALAAALVAAAIPAQADTYVYRAKATTAVADAGSGGPEPVSAEIVREGNWRQIGPGTYRTNLSLAEARTAAGNANRTLVFSYEAKDPAGLFDVSFEPALPEAAWFEELRIRCVGSPSMKTTATMKDGYLYLTSTRPIFVSGKGADFHDFRKVE